MCNGMEDLYFKNNNKCKSNKYNFPPMYYNLNTMYITLFIYGNVFLKYK